jgi:hypothetical protein
VKFVRLLWEKGSFTLQVLTNNLAAMLSARYLAALHICQASFKHCISYNLAALQLCPIKWQTEFLHNNLKALYCCQASVSNAFSEYLAVLHFY